MIFHAAITTNANTTKSAPKLTRFRVIKGLIYKIGLYFPPGSSGLMGVQIFDANYQMYPSTVDEWFIGDDIPYEFDDTYFKDAEPLEFTIKTYNLDDLYEHKVVVMIAMVSENIFIARYVPTEQYEIMKQVFRDIAEEQAEMKRQSLKESVQIIEQMGK